MFRKSIKIAVLFVWNFNIREMLKQNWEVVLGETYHSQFEGLTKTDEFEEEEEGYVKKAKKTEKTKDKKVEDDDVEEEAFHPNPEDFSINSSAMNITTKIKKVLDFDEEADDWNDASFIWWNGNQRKLATEICEWFSQRYILCCEILENISIESQRNKWLPR